MDGRMTLRDGKGPWRQIRLPGTVVRFELLDRKPSSELCPKSTASPVAPANPISKLQAESERITSIKFFGFET
jgi:hypothetical protein